MPRRRRLALLLALPLLLAPVACGDDEGDETGSGSGSASGSAADDTTTDDPGSATDDTDGGSDDPGDGSDDPGDETTTTEGGDDDGDDSGDQEAVDDALALVVDGLTAEGFEPNPDDDDDSDLEFESEECRDFESAFDDELPGESASAESDELARGELTPGGGVAETVEVNVGLTEDADDLDAMFDILRDELFATCMEEALRLAFEEEMAQGGPEIVVEGLVVEPLSTEIGEESAGLTVRATFVAAGFQFPFLLEVEFARQGRAAAMVMAGVIGGDALVVDRAELLTTALAAVTAS